MAAACHDNEDVGEAMSRHNANAMEPKEEIIRDSMIRDTTALTVEDFKKFREFIVRAEELTAKKVKDYLDQLVHCRWATFHVMHPSSKVAKEKRMHHSCPLLPQIFIVPQARLKPLSGW